MLYWFLYWLFKWLLYWLLLFMLLLEVVEGVCGIGGGNVIFGFFMEVVIRVCFFFLSFWWYVLICFLICSFFYCSFNIFWMIVVKEFMVFRIIWFVSWFSEFSYLE